MSTTEFTLTEQEISYLSHEIRNPLAAIQLYAELLSMNSSEPLTEKQQNLVNEIIESNNKILELISEFRNKYKSA